LLLALSIVMIWQSINCVDFQMKSFKGCHFPKLVILHAVFFSLRYSVSHHDLEEIQAERGVAVDHATLN